MPTEAISVNTTTKRIFVLDDANWHNILTKKMLLDCGYEVTTFTNGYSLLENLENEKPHLIITDINMPQLNGFELCKKIKNHSACSNIPVMYVSSMRKEEIEARDKNLCAIYFMQKPILKNQFLDAVAQQV
jgi:CheY-like chemotaxis protein